MSLVVIVHISNEETVVAEIDAMPEATDQIIVLNNPRRKDGRDLHFLDDDVTTMILPWSRINFVEVVPSADAEEVIGFVRE